MQLHARCFFHNVAIFCGFAPKKEHSALEKNEIRFSCSGGSNLGRCKKKEHFIINWERYKNVTHTKRENNQT